MANDGDSETDDSDQECPLYSTKKDCLMPMLIANDFGEDWPESIAQSSKEISDESAKEKKEDDENIKSDLLILERLQEHLIKKLQSIDKKESNENEHDCRIKQSDAIPSTSKCKEQNGVDVKSVIEQIRLRKPTKPPNSTITTSDTNEIKTQQSTSNVDIPNQNPSPAGAIPKLRIIRSEQGSYQSCFEDSQSTPPVLPNTYKVDVKETACWTQKHEHEQSKPNRDPRLDKDRNSKINSQKNTEASKPRPKVSFQIRPNTDESDKQPVIPKKKMRITPWIYKMRQEGKIVPISKSNNPKMNSRASETMNNDVSSTMDLLESNVMTKIHSPATPVKNKVLNASETNRTTDSPIKFLQKVPPQCATNKTVKVVQPITPSNIKSKISNSSETNRRIDTSANENKFSQKVSQPIVTNRTTKVPSVTSTIHSSASTPIKKLNSCETNRENTPVNENKSSRKVSQQCVTNKAADVLPSSTKKEAKVLISAETISSEKRAITTTITAFSVNENDESKKQENSSKNPVNIIDIKKEPCELTEENVCASNLLNGHDNIEYDSDDSAETVPFDYEDTTMENNIEQTHTKCEKPQTDAKQGIDQQIKNTPSEKDVLLKLYQQLGSASVFRCSIQIQRCDEYPKNNPPIKINPFIKQEENDFDSKGASTSKFNYEDLSPIVISDSDSD